MSLLLALLLLMGLFVCTSSSIISAMVLIFVSVCMIGLIYLNMMTVIPVYLFSLFMIGGLFVLIGFVMMADARDLDSAMNSKKIFEYISILIAMIFLLAFMSLDTNLEYLELSFSKSQTIETSLQFSTSYVFAIVFLLIYLLFLYMMVKSSGAGGFVKEWGEIYCSFALNISSGPTHLGGVMEKEINSCPDYESDCLDYSMFL